MRLTDIPPPEYAFGYKAPPRAGNAINGLNETEKRPASVIFHNTMGAPPIDWAAMDQFQKLINSFGATWQVIRNKWFLRLANGPVATKRVAIPDPIVMAETIKALALKHGGGIVGIARIEALDCFEGRAISHPYAICIGMLMDREEMAHVTRHRGVNEVMRIYAEVSRVGVRVAEYIRALGWPAKVYGDSKTGDILQIPLAIKAGLGELGKHGSMICKEYGSNFRLATVVTELPLAIDAPVDIGVDDLCVSCRRCTIDCPPDAIVDEKQLVRGERKWYVDFDKCVPYFTKTHACGICIEVCPWSEPGRGASLSQILLAKRKGADPAN